MGYDSRCGCQHIKEDHLPEAKGAACTHSFCDCSKFIPIHGGGFIGLTSESIKQNSIDREVHRTHCCTDHGCKYGDSHCPVVSREFEQEYSCEQCDEEARRYEISKIEFRDPKILKNTEYISLSGNQNTPSKQAEPLHDAKDQLSALMDGLQIEDRSVLMTHPPRTFLEIGRFIALRAGGAAAMNAWNNITDEIIKEEVQSSAPEAVADTPNKPADPLHDEDTGEDSRQDDSLLGRLTRRVAYLEDGQMKHNDWLRKAKKEAGYHDSISFDVVWSDALKSLLSKTAPPKPQGEGETPSIYAWPVSQYAKIQDYVIKRGLYAGKDSSLSHADIIIAELEAVRVPPVEPTKEQQKENLLNNLLSLGLEG